MRRYIISKDALSMVFNKSFDAVSKMASKEVIDSDTLVYKNLNLASVKLTEDQAYDIKRAGFLIKVEEVRKDVLLGRTYEKVRTKWVKAQRRNITGKGCKVAVIDTGCEQIGTPGTGIWVKADVEVNLADAGIGANDENGHGTGVCSIIKSTLGLANDCELHILKVFADNGDFNESSVLAAIDYCIDNNMDVVNMSFSFYSEPFISAIAELVATETVVIAATGNNTVGESSISCPANLPGVIAVNAINEAGTIHYLNVLGGHGVDFACSGVACELINKSGNVISAFGTSFSSPFLTGLFACYKEIHSNASNKEIIDLMKRKAIKVIPLYQFGYGIPTI